MSLFDWLFGTPKPRRRRSPVGRRSTSRRTSSAPRKPSPAQHRRELDRKAGSWLRADDRRRRQERERERKAELREQAAENKRTARMVRVAEKQRRRSIEAYLTHGLTRAEAEQIVDNYDWEFNPGRRTKRRRPARRNPATRSALGSAASSLQGRKRNPIFGELAKQAAIAALGAVAGEEAKAMRKRVLGPHGTVRPRGKAAKVSPRLRKNPAVRVPRYPDEQLQRMSERFHGERGHILRLERDQRRPLPEYVVDVGQEVATVYQPPRGSRRAGTHWEHQSGDVGSGRRAAGRRRIVADVRGRTYVVPGTSRMRFESDRGLVG